MEKSSKRGKIPQSDWPLIMARYEAGETLASIARTYDCSPPAISYVVSRSRARQPGTMPPPQAPSATEAQLIKAPPGEPAASGYASSPARSPSATDGPSSADWAAPASAVSSANGAPPANGQASSVSPERSRGEVRPAQPEANSADPGDRRGEPWPREANGFVRSGAGERMTTPPGPTLPGLAPRAVPPPQRAPASPGPAGPADGDQRRTLHLSLGSAAPGNGGTPSAEHHPAERQNFVSDDQPAPQPAQGQSSQYQPAGERFAPPERGRESARETGFSEARPPAYHGPMQRTEADAAPRKNGSSSYIDKDLRARVDSDVAAFLAAFDAALAEDTQQSRSALREATDRLLRVGARTQIELERLEARMPLPPRDNIGRGEPAWRQR
jgi:hypothetical protein